MLFLFSFHCVETMGATKKSTNISFVWFHLILNIWTTRHCPRQKCNIFPSLFVSLSFFLSSPFSFPPSPFHSSWTYMHTTRYHRFFEEWVSILFASEINTLKNQHLSLTKSGLVDPKIFFLNFRYDSPRAILINNISTLCVFFVVFDFYLDIYTNNCSLYNRQHI